MTDLFDFVRSNPYFEIDEMVLSPKPNNALYLNDNKLHLPIGEDQVIAACVINHGDWQSSEIRHIEQYINKDIKYGMIDIGANIGLTTRQFLSLFDNIQHVTCFEPHPGNHSYLLKNIGFLDYVDCRNVALSDTHGEMTFYLDNNNFGNYSLNSDAVRNIPHSCIDVAVSDTKEAFEKIYWLEECKHVIWKSDTQGYDELIATQLPMTFWERVDVAIMELWRIEKPNFSLEKFSTILNSFPIKFFESDLQRPVATQEILNYLDSSDWRHDDLIMIRA